MNGSVDPLAARRLQVIAFAMGLGILLLAGVVVFVYFQNARLPTPEGLRLINALTMATMAATAAAAVLSEILWKSLLRRSGELPARLNGAFLARAACREGAAMAGCVTALLAATNGVLRAYPAYWAVLAPAFLFWSFLYVHWPSAANLSGELAELSAK
jgi:hypothetical protein